MTDEVVRCGKSEKSWDRASALRYSWSTVDSSPIYVCVPRYFAAADVVCDHVHFTQQMSVNHHAVSCAIVLNLTRLRKRIRAGPNLLGSL